MLSALGSRFCELVIGNYNTRDDLRASKVEFGAILWASNGQARIGDIQFSDLEDSVNVYPINYLQEILERPDEYIGDYHAHPLGFSWMSQFPSPQDFIGRDAKGRSVVGCSVLCDLWPTTEFDVCLQLSPSIQIIQSQLCGDCFVLEQVANRPRFAEINLQNRAVKRLSENYSNWHQNAHSHYGNIPNNPRPETFDTIVEAALPKIQDIFRERISIEFVKNSQSRMR